MKLLREVLNGIKIVKSLGWEPMLRSKVEDSRKSELKEVGNIQFLIAKIQFLFQISPLLIKIGSITFYVLGGGKLTAAKAFYIIPLLDLLLEPVSMVGITIQAAVGIRVSLYRLTEFLCSEEVIVEEESHGGGGHGAEEVTVEEESHGVRGHGDHAVRPSRYMRFMQYRQGLGAGTMVRIVNGTFRWREGKAPKEELLATTETDLEELKTANKEPDIELLQRQRNDAKMRDLEDQIASLKVDIKACGEASLLPSRGPPTLGAINLNVLRGGISCVVGPVGSGKSSLLAAILNEIEAESGEVTLCGSVAYCAQEHSPPHPHTLASLYTYVRKRPHPLAHSYNVLRISHTPRKPLVNPSNRPLRAGTLDLPRHSERERAL